MGVRVVFPDMGKDPSVQLIEKTITENGTYDAITDGANGYSKVNVNVEGGGGSSDFSTAEVTFNGTASTIPLIVPVVFDEFGMRIIYAVEKGSTFNVPVYKGSCVVIHNDSYTGDYTDFTSTGDIQIDPDGFGIIIKGNGTITYTPAP